MTYQPKVVRCRLKTGGKTIQDIREQYAGQGLTYRDFENIQKANEQFDGLVILLSLWEYDNGEYCTLPEKTDTKESKKTNESMCQAAPSNRPAKH